MSGFRGGHVFATGAFFPICEGAETRMLGFAQAHHQNLAALQEKTFFPAGPPVWVLPSACPARSLPIGPALSIFYEAQNAAELLQPIAAQERVVWQHLGSL